MAIINEILFNCLFDFKLENMNKVFLLIFLTCVISISIVSAHGINDSTSWCDTANCDSTWNYRKKITIDYTKVGTDNTPGYIADFPILLNFTGSHFADLEDSAQSDARDLRFTDLQGNELDWEIEEFDTTNDKMAVWVQANSTGISKSANTIMYVYYKNPVDDEGTITGDSAASTASDSSVWDSSYTGVYHLDDASFGANSVNDSTGNDDLSSLGWDSSASVYGISSLALDFDGNKELDTTNGKNFYNTNGLTVESWIKSDDPTTCNPITTVWKEQNTKRGFNLSVGCTNGKITFQGSADGTAETTITGSTAISAGNWQHVVGTFDGTNLNLFHNGTLDSSVALASLNKPNGIKLNVGTFVSSSDNFDGVIDELRISDSARDSDYIVTTYNNLASPTTFYSIGVEDDGAPEVPVLDITRTSRNTFTISWDTISDSGADVLSYFRINSIVNGGTTYFNYTSPSDPPNATSYNTKTSCSGDGEFKIRAVNSVRASNFSNTVFDETPACRDNSATPEILGVGIYDSTTNYNLPPDTDSHDYYLFDEFDDHVTKNTYTDTEFSIATRVAYEDGLDDIASYAVYLNNRDFYSSKESGETSIFWDNGKLDWDEEKKPELKITDEHELIKDTHFSVIKNGDDKWMIFNITFEKPMEESDVIIDVWDADRNSRIIKLNGIEVLEKPPDEPTPDEPTPDEPTPDEPTPAHQVNVLESNSELEMQVEGNSITWKNIDVIDHIVELSSPDTGNIFYYTTLAPKMSSTKQFLTEGTFDFVCSYHPWVNGVIEVREFDSKIFSDNLKEDSKRDRNEMIARYAGFSTETVSDEEFLKSFDIDAKHTPKYLKEIVELLYREKMTQKHFEDILSYLVEKQVIR